MAKEIKQSETTSEEFVEMIVEAYSKTDKLAGIGLQVVGEGEIMEDWITDVMATVLIRMGRDYDKIFRNMFFHVEEDQVERYDINLQRVYDTIVEKAVAEWPMLESFIKESELYQEHWNKAIRAAVVSKLN